MADADSGVGVGGDLSPYTTYEEYLDAQVGATDKAYIEDPATRRALVELGYRGAGETLRRDEFHARKASERERHLYKDLAPVQLLGAGRDYSGRPLMEALAAREELVRSGKLSTIVYVRALNARGHEVSAYIDFGHRLRTEAWEGVFSGAVHLTPRPSDLSFYNWATGVASASASPNFAVLTDCGTAGVLFKVKRDRKVRGRGSDAAAAASSRPLPQGALSSPYLRHANPPPRCPRRRSSAWTRANRPATTRRAWRWPPRSACRPSSLTTLPSELRAVSSQLGLGGRRGGGGLGDLAAQGLALERRQLARGRAQDVVVQAACAGPKEEGGKGVGRGA
jgi:hypothetical protein